MSVTLNQPIPPFSAQATTGEITSEMFKGRYTVLYFYPKDNTSGCTMEGRDFAALYTQFKDQKPHQLLQQTGFPLRVN